MNRQLRTVIVVLVGVVVASAASFGVYRAISSIPERKVEIATTHAVVAVADLPAGTLLTTESVKLVDWPARTALTQGFSDVKDVIDRGLVAAIVSNEPVTESKLAPKGAGAGLSPTIAPGMRAMSVKVNEVIGVAGFVVPGSRVDVVTVIHGQTTDDTVARVVASNVQVLTAGTRYDQEEARKEGKPMRSTVVTLMVSPTDSERISLAQAEGQLMLSLRNPMDTESPETTGVRRTALFGAPPPVPAPKRAVRPVEPPPPAPAPVVRPYTVETIRAAKRTDEVLK